MPFSELIAQDRAVGSLRAALRRGAVHHAYLFGGPPGVGKGTAARLLAQAVNCEGGAGGPGGLREDPCGACLPCRKIAKGSHPDVLELCEERAMVKAGRWEARSGRSPSKDIVVDQVRDLVDHRLALRRFEGRRRVVVIDPADAMNVQAQNALLKTLEEPPDDTTLVLVSSGADSLLPTIRSRCLYVGFAPLPEPVVAARLEAEGHPAASARLAAALSGGSLGRALSLDEEALAERRAALFGAAALGPDDAGAWIAFAREHGEDREAAAELGELLLVWWRDVLAAQAGSGALALADLADATRRTAAALSPAEALRRRELAGGLLRALRQNATAPLAIERMLVGWFHGR
ncbi:MAG TPA: DNA polymerase III subunit delta' [Anaeromyxobacteraceae bacterium]|nr:DNA polymerase III subunit delta' [Anaeromyxobacteraceae bacterium]